MWKCECVSLTTSIIWNSRTNISPGSLSKFNISLDATQQYAMCWLFHKKYTFLFNFRNKSDKLSRQGLELCYINRFTYKKRLGKNDRWNVVNETFFIYVLLVCYLFSRILNNEIQNLTIFLTDQIDSMKKEKKKSNFRIRYSIKHGEYYVLRFQKIMMIKENSLNVRIFYLEHYSYPT